MLLMLACFLSGSKYQVRPTFAKGYSCQIRGIVREKGRLGKVTRHNGDIDRFRGCAGGSGFLSEDCRFFMDSGRQ
jgi:hypothetical protein